MVKVKKRSIESRRMKRDMHSQATSGRGVSGRERGRGGKLTAQDGEGDEMTCPGAHAELDGGVPPERDEGDTKGGHHDPHGDIRDTRGILFAALELKVGVVAGEQAGEGDEHLPEGRVDVEVELALEVVRAELAKVGLVPHDHVCEADLVEAGPAREERVDGGGEVLEVLGDEFALRSVCQRVKAATTRRAPWKWEADGEDDWRHGLARAVCVCARRRRARLGWT